MLKKKPIVKNEKNRTLKIVSLGRLDYIKGHHILIEAIKSLPNLEIVLDIYGIQKSDKHINYLKHLIEDDSRITFKAPIDQDRVIETLLNYDLLAVPSQWLESGPLVILEAFAANIPVIGSNLGGIKELITNNFDGILVEYNSITEWKKEIVDLVNNREKLDQFKINIKNPKNMQIVTNEMISIYENVLSS